MCVFFFLFAIDDLFARTSIFYGRYNITLCLYPFYDLGIILAITIQSYAYQLAHNKPYAWYLHIVCKTSLQLNLRHVTSTQSWLQSHIRHTWHTSLGYSVRTVCTTSIDIFFFRVRLGLIKQFDFLTCYDNIFTRVSIIYW